MNDSYIVMPQIPYVGFMPNVDGNRNRQDTYRWCR